MMIIMSLSPVLFGILVYKYDGRDFERALTAFALSCFVFAAGTYFGVGIEREKQEEYRSMSPAMRSLHDAVQGDKSDSDGARSRP